MMESFFIFVITLLFGHYVAAIAIYLNHRFVFHGRLGKLPLLRKARKLHLKHHAHAYSEDRNQYFEPLWFKVTFIGLIFITGVFLNLAFTLGIVSFSLLYAYRHKSIHNEDKLSYFSIHHRYHHMVDPKTNYSGVYPTIDYVFQTAAIQKKP